MKFFSNFRSYATFAIIFWLVVTAGLVFGVCHGLDIGLAIFISMGIIWIVVAIFLVWVFTTDGRIAWNNRTDPIKRLAIRALLVFYAICAAAIMIMMLIEMISFLL